MKLYRIMASFCTSQEADATVSQLRKRLQEAEIRLHEVQPLLTSAATGRDNAERAAAALQEQLASLQVGWKCNAICCDCLILPAFCEGSQVVNRSNGAAAGLRARLHMFQWLPFSF